MKKINGRNLKRIYVWQGIVRLFHWVNALTIVILIITGYIIGDPPAFMFNGEAYQSFWFGNIRFLHFAAAYVFTFNFLFRIYYAFNGANKWASWRAFVPANRKFILGIYNVIVKDILMIKKGEHNAIGHNQLAGFSYFILFIVMFLTTITGFGIYADMSTWWFPRLFAWVPAIFGNSFFLRQIHHILMWVFIVFAMIHVHLVIFHELFEGRGEISSMGGGWKFIEEEVLEKETEKV
jgi:Ni/Fe-hydrogenase 1 B-type cytochrome subunit